MVASPPRRMEGNALASSELGQVISDAVTTFAESQQWGPESYDLWYHGAPVWYVRRDFRDPSDDIDATRTLRVQVASFRTSEGPELIVMPDAFVYDWRERRITMESTPEWSAKNRDTASLPELNELAYKDPQQAKQLVLAMIERAWRRIEPAWDNLSDVQMVSTEPDLQ